MTSSRNFLFSRTPTIIEITENNVNKYPIIPLKSKVIEQISSSIPKNKLIYDIDFNKITSRFSSCNIISMVIIA